MIQFRKDGQGFWDFDFEKLAELTNYTFAKEIDYAMKHQFHKRDVFDVQLVETEHFVYVEIYETFGYFTYEYDKEFGDFKRYYSSYFYMQQKLDHARKLGVLNEQTN